METKHTSFMFQGAQGSDSYFWKNALQGIWLQIQSRWKFDSFKFK